MTTQRQGKQYRIPAEGFALLVPPPLGSWGCVISDRITVGGEPVGHAYREAPAHSCDSGWSILSGNETDADHEDPSRHGVWTLNEAANFDRRLIPLLESPPGSVFVADALTSMLVPYHPTPGA